MLACVTSVGLSFTMSLTLRPIPHPLRASHPALLIEPELYQGMAFYDVEMERIRAELEADLQEQRDELEKERQALKFMYAHRAPPTHLALPNYPHMQCTSPLTWFGRRMDLENAIREIKELKLSNEGYKEAMEKIASITATLSTTPEVTMNY